MIGTTQRHELGAGCASSMFHPQGNEKETKELVYVSTMSHLPVRHRKGDGERMKK